MTGQMWISFITALILALCMADSAGDKNWDAAGGWFSGVILSVQVISLLDRLNKNGDKQK